MKDRIKKIRKSFPEYGKTQESFANFLGIPKQNLSSYEIGRRTPSDGVIQLICEKCNVNKEYLTEGKEPIFKEKDGSFSELLSDLEDSDDEFIKDFIKVYMELDKPSKDALKLIAEGMVKKHKGEG